jgi:osmotically-inducible protein OsmY
MGAYRLTAGIVVLGLALQGCVPLVVGGAAATTAVIHDRRSPATVLDDQTIEASVRKLIGAEPAFSESHINVNSYNNVVLLTGEVPSREVGMKAADLVRGVDKVRKIHNELVIAPATSLAQRSNDTLITTGVKSSLFTVDLPKFDPTRVTVVTERGVVYLLGLVSTQEADAATDRARRVSGVQKVVRLFEMTE